MTLESLSVVSLGLSWNLWFHPFMSVFRWKHLSAVFTVREWCSRGCQNAFKAPEWPEIGGSFADKRKNLAPSNPVSLTSLCPVAGTRRLEQSFAPPGQVCQVLNFRLCVCWSFCWRAVARWYPAFDTRGWGNLSRRSEWTPKGWNEAFHNVVDFTV